MTITVITAEFEALFDTVVEFDPAQQDLSRAPGGGRSGTLGMGGVKAETDDELLFASSEAAALRWWLVSAKEYAKDRGRVLYWRRRPEIVATEFKEIGSREGLTLYRVWSRFHIGQAVVTNALAA